MTATRLSPLASSPARFGRPACSAGAALAPHASTIAHVQVASDAGADGGSGVREERGTGGTTMPTLTEITIDYLAELDAYDAAQAWRRLRAAHLEGAPASEIRALERQFDATYDAVYGGAA